MKKDFLVYEIWPSNSAWVPRLNFSTKEMIRYDWIAISEMFGGHFPGDKTRPVNSEYLKKVEITVNSKKMHFDFIMSRLSASADWLVSKRAKLLLDKINTGGVDYYPFSINRHEFYLLVAPYHLTSVDASLSDQEWKKYENFSWPYKKIQFIKSNLTDPMIFSGPLGFPRTYATETVKNAVEHSGLIGWQFVHCEKDEQNEKK